MDVSKYSKLDKYDQHAHKIPFHSNCNNIILKADSGASKSFIRTNDDAILQNVTPNKGPVVALPDMTILRATKEGILPLPGLTEKSSKSVRTAWIKKYVTFIPWTSL